MSSNVLTLTLFGCCLQVHRAGPHQVGHDVDPERGRLPRPCGTQGALFDTLWAQFGSGTQTALLPLCMTRSLLCSPSPPCLRMWRMPCRLRFTSCEGCNGHRVQAGRHSELSCESGCRWRKTGAARCPTRTPTSTWCLASPAAATRTQWAAPQWQAPSRRPVRQSSPVCFLQQSSGPVCFLQRLSCRAHNCRGS